MHVAYLGAAAVIIVDDENSYAAAQYNESLHRSSYDANSSQKGSNAIKNGASMKL